MKISLIAILILLLIVSASGCGLSEIAENVGQSELPDVPEKKFFLALWRKPGLPEIPGGVVANIDKGASKSAMAFQLTSSKSVKETGSYYEKELVNLGWKTKKTSTVKDNYFSGVFYKNGSRITIVGMPSMSGEGKASMGIDIKK